MTIHISPEGYFARYEGQLLSVDPILLERAFFSFFEVKEGLTVRRSRETGLIQLSSALSFDPEWGEVGYADLVAKVGDLYADSKVKRVQFEIMSPGGTTIGNQDAAEALNGFAKQKPTTVWVPAYATSAAYLLATAAASPAKSLYASPEALLASVATIRRRVDQTERLEKAGVKITQFSGGSKKGWGDPNSKMSPEELEHWKAEAVSSTKEFQKSVATFGYGSEQFWADQQGAVLSAKVAGVVNHVQRRNPMTEEEMRAELEKQSKQLAELLEVSKTQASRIQGEADARKKVEAELAHEKAKAQAREAQLEGKIVEGSEALESLADVVTKAGNAWMRYLPEVAKVPVTPATPFGKTPKEQPGLNGGKRNAAGMSREELAAELEAKGASFLDEIE